MLKQGHRINIEAVNNILSKQKIVQLKAIAVQSGNLCSGTKPILVQRLVDHFQSNHEEPGSIVSFDLGYRNLAYCHLNKNAEIIDWARVDLDLPSFHPSVVAPIVRQFIHDRVEHNLEKTDRVLVELQRARSNGGHGVLEHTLRVNCVEALLWGGLYESLIHINRPQIPVVPLNRAIVDKAWKDELDQLAIDYPERFKNIKQKNYRKKQASIVLVEQMLERNTIKCNDHFKTMFETEKKKDDLSDCLIQALSWYKWTRFTNDYIKNNLLE